jgi:hypothetical protein
MSKVVLALIRGEPVEEISYSPPRGFYGALVGLSESAFRNRALSFAKTNSMGFSSGE